VKPRPRTQACQPQSAALSQERSSTSSTRTRDPAHSAAPHAEPNRPAPPSPARGARGSLHGRREGGRGGGRDPLPALIERRGPAGGQFPLASRPPARPVPSDCHRAAQPATGPPNRPRAGKTGHGLAKPAGPKGPRGAMRPGAPREAPCLVHAAQPPSRPSRSPGAAWARERH
jgi:hypothetical protein